MMRRIIGPVIALAALAGLAALAVFTVMPPAVRGDDTPVGEFSATRAFTHVQAVSQGLHVAGSPGNDTVREYLLSTLRGMGLSPTVQDTIGVEEQAETGPPAAARVRNVIAVIPGEKSTGRIFLLAHYDAVQLGPGANDDGAGVGTILETVRALTSGPQQRNDIVVVLTDAEEACLCGAWAFVSQHALAQQGGIVLNVEARGSAGPAIMFETSAGNADVVGVFGANAPHPVGTSFAVEVYRILPNDTDFTPFRVSERFGGLNTAYIDGQAAYHKPQDTADRMDQRSLQHHGDNLLAMAQAFGSADLTQIAKSTGPDATYFPILGVLVTYPAWLVWPLAILAFLVVAGFAVLIVRRKLTTVRRVLAGFGLALAPIIVVPVAVQLFWLLLTTIRPGYTDMIDPWRPGWYRWAVVALVLLILLVWYRLVRSKLDQNAIVAGALGWLALFGVLMATAVPGGSYLTALPALFGGAAAIAALYLPPGGARVAVYGVAAAIAVLILAPTVALFFPALGLATGAAPALFAVLLGLALLPLLDEAPWLDWSWRSAALIVVIMTAVGLTVDRFDERHPMPSHLMYALDTDTGKAIWASAESSPTEWTSQFVSTQDDVEATFPILHDVWTGPAEVAGLTAPQVTVTSEETSGNVRTVRLLITPQRAARLMYLSADGVTKVTFGGNSYTTRERHFELLFHAPPAEGLTVTFELPQGQPLKLRVMDGSDGLTGLPGFKPRPSNVGAAGSHSSDLVLVAKTYTF